MNQEQFGQFWTQLKAPLKAKWEKITDEDLLEIEGNLATFGNVVQKRYGEAHKEEVITWVNRRYSHWTGNYVGAGYKDADPKTSWTGHAAMESVVHLTGESKKRERQSCEKLS